MKLRVVPLAIANNLVKHLHDGTGADDKPFAIISVGETLEQKPPADVVRLSGTYKDALALADQLVEAGVTADSRLVFHCHMGEVRSVRAAAAVGLVLAWRLNPDVDLDQAAKDISAVLVKQKKLPNFIDDGLQDARDIIKAAPKPKRALLPHLTEFFWPQKGF